MRPVADRHILRGAAATLSYQFRDADGEPAAPADAATIGVTAADGTEVVAPGTETTGDDTNPRTYELAAQAQLGLLTATWTAGGVSHDQLVEVVGGVYFDVATARARETAIADQTKYPNAAVIRARREVEAQCELICGVAWVPRYRRTRVSGTGSGVLELPDMALRAVRSVRVYTSGSGYSAFTAGELAAVALGDGDDPTAGLATRTDGGVWPAGRQNIVVEYEHGYDAPPPDLALAAILHLRHQLTMTLNGLSDRATQFQPVDGGNVMLATPGRYGFETGIPQVDAVYQRYSHRAPDGIA